MSLILMKTYFWYINSLIRHMVSWFVYAFARFRTNVILHFGLNTSIILKHNHNKFKLSKNDVEIYTSRSSTTYRFLNFNYINLNIYFVLLVFFFEWLSEIKSPPSVRANFFFLFIYFSLKLVYFITNNSKWKFLWLVP